MKHITDQPIDIAAGIAAAHDNRAGALVIFSGEVRNHNKGQGVDYLFYESKADLAELMIAQIIEDAKQKYELHYVSCVHRIGQVGLSECAILVITSASHREGSYEANRYIVDRVKYEAAIWKREHFSSGVVEWGANSEKKPQL